MDSLSKDKGNPKKDGQNGYNMFKTITSVLSNNTVPDEDIKKIPPFIFRRWLSNHPNGIKFANIFNLYNNIPILQQYNFTKQMVGRVKYIEYPKKLKDIEEELKILQKHYKISFVVAQEYYDTMGPKRVQEIVYKYNKTGLKG